MINQKLIIQNNLKNIQMKNESDIVTKTILSRKWWELSKLWIWENTLQKLSDKWIVNLGQLKALWEKKLWEIITNVLALKQIKNIIENN